MTDDSINYKSSVVWGQFYLCCNKCSLLVIWTWWWNKIGMLNLQIMYWILSGIKDWFRNIFNASLIISYFVNALRNGD